MGYSAYMFGHPITSKNGRDWRYSDGTLHTKEITKTLICPRCELTPTPEGHDPCISNLSGVKYACCGHDKEKGYISFDNGEVVRFADVDEILEYVETHNLKQ